MSNANRTITAAAAPYRYRSFESGEQVAQNEPQNTPSHTQGKHHNAAFFRNLDVLAAIFERETAAVKDGDFTSFQRIQGEKLSAIRSIEKSQKLSEMPESHKEREALQQRLAKFNAIVDTNMKTLDAMRTAVSTVRNYALKTLEKKYTDGVYKKDGALRAPSSLSTNAGNQIKL